MSATVRPARISEADDVLAMYEWLFAPPGAEPPDWDPQRGRANLIAAMESDAVAVWVAEADGRLVGLCTAYIELESVRYGRRCWVEDLAVDPASRSGGIGTRLLDAAAGWAREQGATHLELDTGEARVDAQRFYEERTPVIRSYSYQWQLYDPAGS